MNNGKITWNIDAISSVQSKYNEQMASLKELLSKIDKDIQLLKEGWNTTSSQEFFKIVDEVVPKLKTNFTTYEKLAEQMNKHVELLKYID